MAVTPSQFPTINLADLDGTETIWVQKGGIDYKLPLESVKLFGGCDEYCGELLIPSAQVLTSFASPVQILPAPGAGYAWEVVSASGKLAFGTTPYATNTNLLLIIDTGTTGQIRSTGFLAAASTTFKLLGPNEGDLIENKALMFMTQTGNPTAGDSDITIYYKVLKRAV